MKKTYLTPEYCRKAVKSWLADAQPQTIGELIAFADATVDVADPLHMREKYLAVFSDASDYMREVILIATRPVRQIGYEFHCISVEYTARSRAQTA